ncbi:70 kDa peptidyl-prolyl isomerase [Chrysoperla carnea]|uniref:70 kDa peptidyl-prolyl isomerase n=1 Tax=Chrysoperla carnea TaxID=189513 RepID=UPI001D08F698|nr:70 kDa peptidyl-prolyl isomerase [Chrysoperla carnea]
MSSKVFSKDGIHKTVIENGVIGEKPVECCVCTIVLSDIEINGSNYDTEYIRQEKNGIEQNCIMGEFDTKLDRKFEKLLETMLENEFSDVKIQLNETIITFKIKLLKLEFNGYFFDFPADKKYALATKHKERGVELFQQNRYIDAFYRFSKACRLLITCILEIDDVESTEIDGVKLIDIENLKLILYGNLASCQLKQNNYEEVIPLCSKILVQDSEHVKSLYKRGLAYTAVRDFEKAENDLVKFLQYEPNNKFVHEKLNYVRHELVLSRERYAEMCKRMF